MNAAVRVWLFFRALRWLLWLATLAFYVAFFIDRQSHLTQFGHLLTSTEFWMFGLPTAAVFAGFFELMMRERACIARPAIGRNWTAPETAGSQRS